MLQFLFGGGEPKFDKIRFNGALKMGVSRLRMHQTKLEQQIKAQRREIAGLLRAKKDDNARIRVEAVIQAGCRIDAYEIIILFCELVSQRVQLIVESARCPPDIKEATSSLIWACSRVENVDELVTIRAQLAAKFGREFVDSCIANAELSVNSRLHDLLSIHVPEPWLCFKTLKAIADEFDITWSPSEDAALSGLPVVVPHGNGAHEAPYVPPVHGYQGPDVAKRNMPPGGGGGGGGGYGGFGGGGDYGSSTVVSKAPSGVHMGGVGGAASSNGYGGGGGGAPGVGGGYGGVGGGVVGGGHPVSDVPQGGAYKQQPAPVVFPDDGMPAAGSGMGRGGAGGGIGGGGAPPPPIGVPAGGGPSFGVPGAIGLGAPGVLVGGGGASGGVAAHVAGGGGFGSAYGAMGMGGLLPGGAVGGVGGGGVGCDGIPPPARNVGGGDEDEDDLDARLDALKRL